MYTFKDEIQTNLLLQTCFHSFTVLSRAHCTVFFLVFGACCQSTYNVLYVYLYYSSTTSKIVACVYSGMQHYKLMNIYIRSTSVYVWTNTKGQAQTQHTLSLLYIVCVLCSCFFGFILGFTHKETFCRQIWFIVGTIHDEITAS